ncbi:MAG: hypothetical protein RL662_595 [Bacteroidota bacterium]|jgi:tRNA threonylcarbamoyl adenosine modification protein (Sua5/YciO/YrdC/YwlC family)
MLIKLYNNNTNQKDIDRVVKTLQDGGLIIYPTDTVYAMGCDALNVKAVEKICKLKGINPAKHNLSIICYDLSNISEYAKIDNSTFKLMKKNLPGAFTFILNTTSSLPKIYKEKRTVGIRVPDNNIIREIVNTLGNPILTTSLKDDNDSSEYLTDPELIDEKYNRIVDLVVDGGHGETEASTIIDCTGNEPQIMRQAKGELIW